MDLTTKLGRQQAHAAGGEVANTATLIEDALRADDREINYAALAALEEVPSVFSRWRQDDLQRIHDELGKLGVDFDAQPLKELRALLSAMAEDQADANQQLEDIADMFKGGTE